MFSFLLYTWMYYCTISPVSILEGEDPYSSMVNVSVCLFLNSHFRRARIYTSSNRFFYWVVFTYSSTWIISIWSLGIKIAHLPYEPCQKYCWIWGFNFTGRNSSPTEFHLLQHQHLLWALATKMHVTPLLFMSDTLAKQNCLEGGKLNLIAMVAEPLEDEDYTKSRPTYRKH